VKPARRTYQQASALIFRQRINDAARKLIDRSPAFGGFVVEEKPTIRAAVELAFFRLVQRADKIAFRIVSHKLNTRRAWIVTTDAAVGAEPHYRFAIDKDGVDVVRTQPTEGYVKSETYNFLWSFTVKNAASIRPDHHTAMPAV